jgi:hypothetical protein
VCSLGRWGYFKLRLSHLKFGGIFLCIVVKIIWEEKIVCPKCHTPLNVSIKSNSRYFQGYSPFVPEECVKCGANLNKLDKHKGVLRKFRKKWPTTRWNR